MSLRLLIISSVVLLCLVVHAAGGGPQDPMGNNEPVGTDRPSKNPARCTLKGYKKKCKSNAECCSNNCKRKKCGKAITVVANPNANCMAPGATNCTAPLSTGNSTCCTGTCQMTEGGTRCPEGAASTTVTRSAITLD